MSEQAETLEQRLVQATTPSEQILARLDLCAAIDQRDAHRVLRLAREATALAAELDDPALQGRCWLEQGVALFTLNELADALAAYEQAGQLFQQAGDEVRRADAIRGMGIVYERLDDFERALAHLFSALHVYEAHGNRKAHARTLNSIGVVYSRSGRPEDGLAAYAQAYQLHRQLDSLLDAAMTRNNMGINLKNLERYDEAEEALLEALALLEQAGSIYYAGALSNLALVYERQGRLDEAETAHRRACELARHYGVAYVENESLLCLGRFYLAQGRLDEARPLLEAALERSRAARLPSKEAEAHQALAALYKRAGQPAQALDHLEAGHRLERQVFNEQSDQRLKNLQVSFQVERIQREAELERREREALGRAYKELEELHHALQDALQQKEALLKRLERLSHEDALTGLYNRRYLEQRLVEEFARARRYRHPLTVALADIDNFKQINDRLSHAIGDLTLKQVAQILRQTLRQTDIVARYGGEEFAMVFPETYLEDARYVCQKVRIAVEQYPWQTIHPDLRVTLSIGVSDDLSLVNHEKLLADADHWMYQAKYSGKNRVCWRGESLQLDGIPVA
jgi:diguanylate cyclase (GGDEF)-like protein